MAKDLKVIKDPITGKRGLSLVNGNFLDFYNEFLKPDSGGEHG